MIGKRDSKCEMVFESGLFTVYTLNVTKELKKQIPLMWRYDTDARLGYSGFQ